MSGAVARFGHVLGWTGNGLAVLLAIVALSLAGVVIPDRAFANQNSMTGEGLLDVCTRAKADWIGFCNGYIQAAVDLLALQEGGACIPEGTTRNEVYDAVFPLLSASSAMKGENAFRALTAAITVKFKCE